MMKNPEDLNLKGKRITVRPSPLSSVATLILSILFLIFGIALIGSDLGQAGEASGFMGAFLIIWIVVCLGMAIYSLINLASYGKSRPNPAALEVLEIEDTKVEGEKTQAQAKEEAARSKPDFAVKLRELEALRKDGLLTEEEYQRKRREILDEKW